MASYGVSISRQMLIAVVMGEDRRLQSPLAITRCDDDRCWLLQHLEKNQGLDCAMVISDLTLRLDPIAVLARQLGAPVWVAPEWLLLAIAAATGAGPGPPRRRAGILARLPYVAQLRPFLRRFAGAADDPRQLRLIDR